MAELTCASCGAATRREDALCRGCGRPPVAPPAVAAPAPLSRAQREAEVRAARADLDSPLPVALRGRYRVERPIDVASTEADLYVVVALDGDGAAEGGIERRVLKRYRVPQPPQPGPGASEERRASIAQDFEVQQARRRAELRAVLERLGEVHDDHVIGIDEFDVDEGWELLEHVGRGTLEDLIRQLTERSEPVGEEQLRHVVEELALALVAIHAAGLNHGDIKPGNVLVRSDQPFDLVLTDFGSMVPMHASTYVYDGGMQDSALYAAPELTVGARTTKQDVFAVGRIIERMLRTRLGSGADVDADVLVSVDDPADRRRWELLLRGTLHPRPEERWSAEELLAWARGEDVRRVLDRAAAIARSDLLVVAGHTPMTAVDMARLIAADRGGWNSGRDHLERGRLRRWAEEAMPELARALESGGDLEAIDDLDLRLLEVLLWIDPEIPPAFAGWSLSPGGIAELHDASVSSSEWRVPRALIEYLASDAGTKDEDQTAARAVTALARGASRAREPLRRLIDDMVARRRELDAAIAALGLSGSLTELRIRLLLILAREHAGLGSAAPGQLAVLRRPRSTWDVLRRASGPVRATLVPLVQPARPLRDARRALRMGRRRSHRPRSNGLLRLVRLPLAALSAMVRVPSVLLVETFRASPRRAILGIVAASALGLGAFHAVFNVAYPIMTVRTPFDARIPAHAFVADPDPVAFRGGAGRSNAWPDPVAPGRERLQRLWSRQLASGLDDSHFADTVESFAPVVSGDHVIVASAGNIFALDAASGDLRWERTSSSFHMPPAVTRDTVYSVRTRRWQVFTTDLTWLTAYSVDEGRIRWRVRIAPGFLTESDASPVVADGRVFLRIPSTRRPSLIAVDARTGSRLWMHTEPSNVQRNGLAGLLSDPIVLGGQVYAVFQGPERNTARLVALDAATGEVIWRERPVPNMGGRNYGPLQVASDGRTLVAATGGAIRAYRSPSGGPLGGALGRLTPQWTRQLLPLTASPRGAIGVAVTEHAVYVGVSSAGRLFAYHPSSGELLWQAQLPGFDDDFYRIMPHVAGDSVFVVGFGDTDGFWVQEFDAFTGEQLRTPHQSSPRAFVFPWLATSDGRLFVLTEQDLIAYG